MTSAIRSGAALLALALLTRTAHADLPISICDASNSPKTRLATRGGYAFCDSQRWITENEFIRRYREATGARDLDRHLTVRSRTRWIAAAVIGAVGLGLFTYGMATLKHDCGVEDFHDVACLGPKQRLLTTNQTYSVMSETLAALGGGMFLGATVVFFAGPGRDGSPLDHRLNRLAAEIMVKRYEEARRPERGVQEDDARLEVRPYVSANGAGIVAQF